MGWMTRVPSGMLPLSPCLINAARVSDVVSDFCGVFHRLSSHRGAGAAFRYDLMDTQEEILDGPEVLVERRVYELLDLRGVECEGGVDHRICPFLP